MKSLITLSLFLISTAAFTQSLGRSCRYHSDDFQLIDGINYNRGHENKNFIFLKDNKVFEVQGFHRTEKVYPLRQLPGVSKVGLLTNFYRMPTRGCLDGLVSSVDEGTLVEMKPHDHAVGKLHPGSSSIIVNAQKDKLIYLGKTEDQKLVFSRMGVTRGGIADYEKEVLPTKFIVIAESDLGEIELLRSSIYPEGKKDSPKDLFSHNYCHMGFFTDKLANENEVKHYEIDELKKCESSKRNSLCLKGSKSSYHRALGYGEFKVGIISVAYLDPKVVGIKLSKDFFEKNPLFCPEVSYCRSMTNIDLEIEYFDRLQKTICEGRE